MLIIMTALLPGQQSICPWPFVSYLQRAKPPAAVKHPSGEHQHPRQGHSSAYEPTGGGTIMCLKWARVRFIVAD